MSSKLDRAKEAVVTMTFRHADRRAAYGLNVSDSQN
jgi:hypothetical protein